MIVSQSPCIQVKIRLIFNVNIDFFFVQLKLMKSSVQNVEMAMMKSTCYYVMDVQEDFTWNA